MIDIKTVDGIHIRTKKLCDSVRDYIASQGAKSNTLTASQINEQEPVQNAAGNLSDYIKSLNSRELGLQLALEDDSKVKGFFQSLEDTKRLITDLKKSATQSLNNSTEASFLTSTSTEAESLCATVHSSTAFKQVARFATKLGEYFMEAKNGLLSTLKRLKVQPGGDKNSYLITQSTAA